MGTDWFIEYEKGYLISYINRKRVMRGEDRLVKDFTELERIIKEEQIKGETELQTTKRLINEIRKGRKI